MGWGLCVGGDGEEGGAWVRRGGRGMEEREGSGGESGGNLSLGVGWGSSTPPGDIILLSRAGIKYFSYLLTKVQRKRGTGEHFYIWQHFNTIYIYITLYTSGEHLLAHPVHPTKGNPASPPMLKARPRSLACTTPPPHPTTTTTTTPHKLA